MNNNITQRSLLSLSVLLFLSAACGGPDLDVAETESGAGGSGGGSGGSTPPPNQPPPVYIPPALKFSNLWDYDPVTGDIAISLVLSGQVQTTYPYRDYAPHYVHLVYGPNSTMTNAMVDAINSGWTYVSLNGAWLSGPPQGGNEYSVSYYLSGQFGLGSCPNGQHCLGIEIFGARFYQVAPPWNLGLTYWDSNTAAWKTVSTTVYPAATTSSYFESRILPTFYSQACAKCHQLNTTSELQTQHNNAVYGLQVTQKKGLFGTVNTCAGNCHESIVDNAVPGVTFTSKEWMTPALDQGTNWSLMTPPEICAKVTQNLATAAEQNTHFFQDARIGWAVANGKLPGNAGYEALAAPQSWSKFVTYFSAWINAGAPCP